MLYQPTTKSSESIDFWIFLLIDTRRPPPLYWALHLRSVDANGENDEDEYLEHWRPKHQYTEPHVEIVIINWKQIRCCIRNPNSFTNPTMTNSRNNQQWFGSRVSNSNCLKILKLKPNQTSKPLKPKWFKPKPSKPNCHKNPRFCSSFSVFKLGK